MTDRARYTMKMAFKAKLGVWFSDTELDQFLDYLNSQGIKIEESV